LLYSPGDWGGGDASEAKREKRKGDETGILRNEEGAKKFRLLIISDEVKRAL